MLASALALGLSLLPSTFAYVHNVQVGAEGKLLYSPEAIVRPLSCPQGPEH
jgi:hypothetical protein